VVELGGQFAQFDFDVWCLHMPCNLQNDDVLYPEWSDFVQDLRTAYGVRTLSYINSEYANPTHF
jgi:hypothetical protein